MVAVSLANKVLSREKKDITLEAQKDTADQLSKIANAKLKRGSDLYRGSKFRAFATDRMSGVETNDLKEIQPNIFYSPTDKLRSEGEIKINIRRGLTFTQKEGEENESTIQSLRDSITKVIYELFSNTHYWARTDTDGIPISRSIRGVIIENHKRSNKERKPSSGVLREYIDRVEGQYDQPSIPIIEITVFDSGPGLATRFMGEPINGVSLDDEYNACINALRKNRSSSSSDIRGFGLSYVADELSKRKGFWHLRTGRLSLYRDYATTSDTPNGLFDDPEVLHDIDSKESLVEHANVSGLVITLLIPIIN